VLFAFFRVIRDSNALHDPNLLRRQTIQSMHQRIQLPLPFRHLLPLPLCIQQLAHQRSTAARSSHRGPIMELTKTVSWGSSLLMVASRKGRWQIIKGDAASC
jgi:hypothetical protein